MKRRRQALRQPAPQRPAPQGPAAKRKATRGAVIPETRVSRAIAWVSPPLLAILLVLPLFSLSYLYDDFDFLGRAQTFHVRDLLPDPGTLYYRPLSREAYFALLYAIDPRHAIWGHLGNAALLCLAALLVACLARRVAGTRAGLLAGVVFASLGAFPTLVGWVSCSQDVFAVTLVLLALHFQLADRIALAALATALALLSKETSIAFLPAIVLARWLLERKPYHLRATLVSQVAIAGLWAAFHPGIRLLISRRFESSPEAMGSLTFSGADRWGSIWRSFATLGNLPLVAPSSTGWSSALTPFFFAGAVLLAAAIAIVFRHRADRTAGTPSMPRVLSLGALLTIPAVLLISALVRRWQPYYLVLPSIGTSFLAGVAGARLPRVPAAIVAIGFLALGIWYRGTDLGPSIPTEINLRPPSDRLRRVEANFLALLPRLDGAAHVYVTTETPEDRDIPFHLIRFQVLRIWYRNPAIETMHPERRRPNPPGERLAWIAPDLSLHAIDPVTLQTRSVGGVADSLGYGATLRAFAQGLAASGETDRAVRILLAMRESDPWYTSYDRRLAAALLLAQNRRAEADSLLHVTPFFNREDSIEAAAELLANPPRLDLDAPVLTAMGLSPDAPEDARAMMRWFALNRYPEATIRFAQRLLAKTPNDAEAAAVLRALQPASRWERVTVPVEHDALW